MIRALFSKGQCGPLCVVCGEERLGEVEEEGERDLIFGCVENLVINGGLSWREM